ncbi:MAG: hypothetical protein ABEK50_00300 [bacterium]
MDTLSQLLMNRWLHHVNVLLHICAGLFWMGWIVFIFLLLIPTLRSTVSNGVEEVLPVLKTKIRRVVFWLIVVITITGIHNVFYTGLYRWRILTGTEYGQRFLIKLGAALVLFSVYAIAPYLTSKPENTSGSESCSSDGSGRSFVMVMLHVVAFSAGITAALLGISLSG